MLQREIQNRNRPSQANANNMSVVRRDGLWKRAWRPFAFLFSLPFSFPLLLAPPESKTQHGRSKTKLPTSPFPMGTGIAAARRASRAVIGTS